jgi:uncharacterized protein YbjQ (UPF0145 family)/DNA-directed RNA polymerase subunit RPC12/RpoP
MLECTDCGRAIDAKEAFNGRCSACHSQYLVKDIDRSETDAQRRERYSKEDQEKQKEDQASINRIMVTTEAQPAINIKERITIITAECAYGMNVFKDLFAGVRNIVGGRSEAIQSTMRDARETVIYELKREAHRVGANAVVGVDLDYVELAATGSTMLMLVASGTAVRIEE